MASAALSLVVPHAIAQTPVPQENELGSVEQEITSSAESLEKIKNDIAAAIRDQEEISGKLITIARTIQSQETAITAAEERILKLRKEEITLRADLAENQEVLSELLAGLQRLEQNPPPALVVEPNDVLAALRGAMMFGTIVPELRSNAEILGEKLARLDKIRLAVEKEKATLNGSIINLKTFQVDLGQLIIQKKQLVFDSSGKLEEEKRRSGELARKAKSLKQLIADLAAARLKEEAKKTKLALALEAERKRQEEFLLRPSVAFSSTKGRLEYPVQGQILKRFGQDDGLGSELRGMAVATRALAQVTAPADGKVEFAGPFRSYGQLLILDAGEGYLVLMAGMKEISADIGQTVRAGEPVGIMGKGPSSVTLLGDQIQEARPVLYVELRKNGEAVDSAPWWIGGTKEAFK
ncbi:MAG TPA: peptidoglycan DD-metalloendopeptidase family protein [Aestuariivirga sp.]|nr:peptidoglycan DD-metalloendopeptidase family protein [Aestuariivirga sp.]